MQIYQRFNATIKARYSTQRPSPAKEIKAKKKSKNTMMRKRGKKEEIGKNRMNSLKKKNRNNSLSR